MRERREYTLDVANILHGIWAGFGDVAIIKKYFNDVRRGQLPYRVLPSCILGAKREGNRVLVDGGTFVLRLWEYYEFSGNRVALEEMFEPAYSFIKHLEEYSDDNGLIGKLPYPVFIDWSDIDFRGSSLCINAIFTQAMKTLSDMADVLGMSDISDEYGKKFQKLCGLISGLFWDAKRGIFVDALIDGVKSEHVSEHGNYLMILFGFASAPQTKSIIEFLREPSNEIGRLEPLFYWASEALFKARESALALNMMRGRYGRIRKQGLDTISELWSLRGERFTGSWRSRDSRSACQSGGVSAAYLLSKSILGISPLKPGFEEVLISPQPCDLTWARGTFPSPKGPIRVKWERDDEKFALECKLPDELPVKIKLPHYLPALRSITVNGETMPYEEY